RQACPCDRRRDGRRTLATRARRRLRRHARRQPRELRGRRRPARTPKRRAEVTDTRLELELREQPAALERLLHAQGAAAKDLGALLRRRDVRYLLIASR